MVKVTYTSDETHGLYLLGYYRSTKEAEKAINEYGTQSLEFHLSETTEKEAVEACMNILKHNARSECEKNAAKFIEKRLK